MYRKTVSGVLLVLLVTSILVLAVKIQPVKAVTDTPIYINADGNITPSTAPIQRNGNTYTLTGNIAAATDGIVIEIGNIILDGAGYSVAGNGSGYGIMLLGRNNVTIDSMTITNFDSGIWLNSSSNDALSGNNVKANVQYGIWLTLSSNNVLFGNNIANNEAGIFLASSPNNTLSGNTMVGNSYNLDVMSQPPVLSDFLQSIDISNLAGGKPVYYFVNQSNIVVNGEAYPEVGYLGFVNCVNVTVQGLNLTGNGQGLLLAFTNNSTITGNNFTHNSNGIWLSSSSNNTLSNNNIANNSGGIWFDACYNNVLSNNNITNNGAGIVLDTSSSNNTLSGNNVTNNNWIINVAYSSDNFIFHNNFMNNTNQAATIDSVDVWDDGYPSGGNYWSSYNGIDLYSGPSQNITGSDGIGDTPYIIDANNTDRYPLMQPWTSPLASGNLFVNPSFEDNLTGWGTSVGTAVYSVDNATSHSGSYSCKGVEMPAGSLGRLYQDVTNRVVPGEQYQISGWIKTSGVTNDTRVVIGLGYVDAGGVYPADDILGETKEEIGEVTGTQDWTFYQSPVFTLGPMPSDAAALWFLFDFNGGGGTAWWDDVSLARASPVTNVTCTKTIVGQAFNTSLDVTIANQSNFTQTFNVTAYANATSLGSQAITLGNNSVTLLTFAWSSSGFAYGNYPISVGAADSNFTTAENNFAGGLITVSIPGDLNGDFKVSLADLVLLANAYGSHLGQAKWNPNADINGNGVVDLADLVILAIHYGQHYP